MKSVKMLGISGSPRQGNSLYFLKEAFKCIPELRIPVEPTIYSFHAKKIGPCLGCLVCYKNGGKCVVNDDFQEIRQMWIASDAIIYSVPVYVIGIPGQLKSFIDRLHNSFYGFYDTPSMRHLKAIGCIAQGEVMYGGQDLAMQNLLLHATLINSVAVAPDGSYIGAGGWTGKNNNRNACKQRAAKGVEDVSVTIQVARSVVQRVAEVAAILKAGALALRDILELDPRYLPYLSRISSEG